MDIFKYGHSKQDVSSLTYFGINSKSLPEQTLHVEFQCSTHKEWNHTAP